MKVLVVGGAGHIGSVLVPMLLEKGHEVRVLDTFWFWRGTSDFEQAIQYEGDSLTCIKGDIRNEEDVIRATEGVDAVIHLACLSNDPSADIDKDFTHDINFNGSKMVIDKAKELGVKRFIYASSSSVYGIKEGSVTEKTRPAPLTQYSQLKLKVEKYLLKQLDDKFQGVIIRPSTVCGMSPRMRLDLVANAMTFSAVRRGKITVNGGPQLRPLIHIRDISRLYVSLLEMSPELINKEIFNAGYDNYSLDQIATMISEITGARIENVSTNDLRSYHVNSEKIRKRLLFEPRFTIDDAVKEMASFFKIWAFDGDRYYNIKTIKNLLGYGRNLEIITPLHKKTQRDYLKRMIENKVEAMDLAKTYGKEYWDGDRRYGYGGYKYIPGYWKPVAEALIKVYDLNNYSKVLDVGCGKAHLLYELKRLLPGLKIQGIDISEYAITNAPEEIRTQLRVQSAQDTPYKTPFAQKIMDKYFDLVISITTLHNLSLPDLKKALLEIERVGKHKYIAVESYRNNLELFNLQCWALTCDSFFTPEEWRFLFQEYGCNTDYEFIYFE